MHDITKMIFSTNHMHYKCKIFYVNSIYIKKVANCSFFTGFCVFGIHLRAPNLAQKPLLEPLCCVRIGKDPLSPLFSWSSVCNLSCFQSWELCTLTSLFLSWRSFTYIIPVLLVLSHPLDHFLSLFFSLSAVCENVYLYVRLSIFFSFWYVFICIYFVFYFVFFCTATASRCMLSLLRGAQLFTTNHTKPYCTP